MKLEQQIYTSGKPEFTTVAATDGLNRADRILLIAPVWPGKTSHTETIIC